MQMYFKCICGEEVISTSYSSTILKLSSFFFLNKYIYFYLFIFGSFGSLLLRVGSLQLRRAGAALHCSAWAFHCGGFSCCRAQSLGTQASVVVAHGLSSCGLWAPESRLRSCGARAQLLHSMWDLSRRGLESVSPALAGGFLTTAPPGKPKCDIFLRWNILQHLKELDLCVSVCTGKRKLAM